MTLSHSEQINELAAALAKAQGEIEGATKGSLNPHFRSKYADLASVWDAVRGPLSKHGIAVVQVPGSDGSRVGVETMLLHISGQWIRGLLTVSAKDEGPQAAGSCITYLRRYALQSFAGVAPEDDDAEAAEGRNGQRPATTKILKPTGYDDWLADMTACADNGEAALREAWKGSKPIYREYATKHDAATWDGLKAKAAKAEPVNA